MDDFERFEEKVLNINLSHAVEYENADKKIGFQNFVLDGINRIFREVLECDTEEALGCLCLNILEELTQSKFGFIGELSPEGKLYDIAMSNLGRDVWKIPNSTEIELRETSTGFNVHDIYERILFDGKPSITNDSIILSKEYPPLNAFVGVPLKDGVKTIGMIGLGNREGGYTIKELETIEMILPAIVQAFKYKKSQEALKRNEQHYRELFNNTSEGIFLLEVTEEDQFKLVEINLVEKEFVKLTNHKVEGRNIDEVYSREFVEVLIDKLKMCIEARNLIEFKECQKHKSEVVYFSIKLIPVEDTTGRIYRILGIRNNITEQVEKDKIIKMHRHQLEVIIENMPDAFLVYNKEGHITLLNAEARKLYPELNAKKTIEEAQSCFKYFDLDNKIIPPESFLTRRAFRGEEVRDERIVVKRPHKIQITEVNTTPIFDEEHNLVSVVVSHRDISDVIKSQEEIKVQQEKLLNAERAKNEALEESIKLKDEFFYLITHEFKTPISVINLALQAINLMYKEEITEKAGKYLNTIKQNINRQLRLVNNLLDIARINSGHLKMNKNFFDIANAVETIVNSVEVYAEQKNVTLKLNTNLSANTIYSDEEKLERILLNLLSNALKFTPGGKSITISLSTKKYKNADMISVSVQDEGLGIPRDKQKTIFQRFGQVDSSLSRQAEGTGLGLHLVNLLVNLLGGEILLDSVVDKGSTFTVLLPASESEIYYEESACSKINNNFLSDDDRIIQSAAIEFSDMHFQ
ncbi:ATP-binding protein [Clostridium sp. WILCCON 0269]|uniref:histidine kinase n=1 Tax=Candidatus Clostridium eludens TaxID=3381663 RepID=A0ABW8SI45_9CLOT